MVIGVRSFTVLFLLLVSSFAYCITYVPGHQRLIYSEMDGWVQGAISDISYRKNKFGKVESVLSVKVNRFSGIKVGPNEPNEFSGTLSRRDLARCNYKLVGTPTFELKKEYIFLIERKVGGFYINGLSAGVIPTSKKNSLDKISSLEDYSISKFGKIYTLDEKIDCSK